MRSHNARDLISVEGVKDLHASCRITGASEGVDIDVIELKRLKKILSKR